MNAIIAIKFIKYLHWENHMMHRVFGVREDELSALKKGETIVLPTTVIN